MPRYIDVSVSVSIIIFLERERGGWGGGGAVGKGGGREGDRGMKGKRADHSRQKRKVICSWGPRAGACESTEGAGEDMVEGGVLGCEKVVRRAGFASTVFFCYECFVVKILLLCKPRAKTGSRAGLVWFLDRCG